MTEMKGAKEDLEAWKLAVDGRVADLESAVLNLGVYVKQLIGNRVCTEKKSFESPLPDPSKAGSVLMPGSAHLELTPSGAASGSIDHHVENRHRGSRFGVVYTTLTPSPVTGAGINHIISPASLILNDSALSGNQFNPALFMNPTIAAAIPNFGIPQFDGSNPKLWVTKCKT